MLFLLFCGILTTFEGVMIYPEGILEFLGNHGCSHSWASHNLLMACSWKLCFPCPEAWSCAQENAIPVSNVIPAIWRSKNHSLIACSWTIHKLFMKSISFRINQPLINRRTHIPQGSQKQPLIISYKFYCGGFFHSWISHNSYSGLS